MESPSSQPSPESGLGSTGGPQSRVSISLAAADCINYAAWQNSVPVVHSLEITNHRSEALHDLRLELSTTPAFARDKHWNIQKIEAGAVYALKDRNIQIDPKYLSGLDEAERGVVRLQLFEGETVVAETERDIRVLAKDEWGGMQSMGELLAAFVTPNDPTLAKLLKTAADVLAKHGHSPALDGYQSGDPSRAYMLATATWSAVAAQSLTYANPPKSFEQVGQKTRRITAILQHGLATCLDSTLLFAAALEALGLNPIIVMKREHCFVGVWLVERTLSRLIEEDCSEIRVSIPCTATTAMRQQHQLPRAAKDIQRIQLSFVRILSRRFHGRRDAFCGDISGLRKASTGR